MKALAGLKLAMTELRDELGRRDEVLRKGLDSVESILESAHRTGTLEAYKRAHAAILDRMNDLRAEV